MWQTKYASAVPKNLGLGFDFRPCSEGDFLNVLPQSVVRGLIHQNAALHNKSCKFAITIYFQYAYSSNTGTRSKYIHTGKSLSDALFLAEHGENMLYTKIVLNVRNNLCTQRVLPRFELGTFMYRTCNSMNNLQSYCGLVDAKIRASDKDLPVKPFHLKNCNIASTLVCRCAIMHVRNCKQMK